MASNSYGMNDFHYYYKTNHSKSVLSSVEFRNIIRLFFTKLADIILKGSIVTLPYGLGLMYIFKYKPKVRVNKNGDIYVSGSKAVDFNATMKLWKDHPNLRKKQYIYYENEHSDGYKFKLNKGSFSKGILNLFYNFGPSSTFSREMSKVIFKNPNIEYLE